MTTVAEPIPHKDANEEAWADDAHCKEVPNAAEVFFPERGTPVEPAKRHCRKCLVQAECLTFALENCERFGIWGGASERERRQMRKRITQGAPVHVVVRSFMNKQKEIVE